jgi:hypothetical protein
MYSCIIPICDHNVHDCPTILTNEEHHIPTFAFKVSIYLVPLASVFLLFFFVFVSDIQPPFVQPQSSVILR